MAVVVEVTPVPLNATDAGEFVALLFTVTVPLYACAAAGSNETVKAADWFGVNTVPEETPLIVNPVPATETLETVTFEFPLLVSSTLRGSSLPTVTFPKSSVVGVTPSRYVAATPVPDSETARGDAEVLFTKDTEPLKLVAELGSKLTLKAALFPAVMVRGVVKPLILKPLPEMLADETVRSAVPVFFREIVCESVVPVTTLPKLTLEGVAEI